MQTYSEGFRAAARRLAVDIIEGGNSMELLVDLVVYPMIFLYRHHFELQLKLLVRASRSLLGEPRNDAKTHQLHTLWGIAWPLAQKAFPDADWSQNQHVTRLLNELSALDPNGEAARYDVDGRGEQHFKDLSLINVRHFAEVAEKLGDYLDDVLNAVAITNEQRMEWEAEMMSDYRSWYIHER